MDKALTAFWAQQFLLPISPSFRYATDVAPLLSDKDAAEIERQRREGVTGGPLVLTWVDRLLADRRERVRQLEYLRQRLRQAFRYLDALFGPASEVQRAAGNARRAPVVCPLCRKPYLRASGISPRGIEYQHEEGRVCRAG
jgi:hypothetical protein